MKKRLLSLALILLLSLSLAIPTSAAEAKNEGASGISVRGKLTRVDQVMELYQEDVSSGHVGDAQIATAFNQMAGGSPITISNVGTDTSAVFYVYYRTYTFRTKSTITHSLANGADTEVDMVGRYFGYSDIQYLADHPSETGTSTQAADGLYWTGASSINAKFAAKEAKVLKPGESVTVMLPDDWADTLYMLYVEVFYPNGSEYYGRSVPLKFDPVRSAAPTSSTVLVNGEKTAFDAYNIGGSNYFKLRDLAYVLSGTPKQFEVSWDGEANCISLISGQAYTPVGGEMGSGGTSAQTATPTKSKILLDGKEVYFTAYLINGNNYFKLRDVGDAFDFGVDWDGNVKTIAINTSKGYTPD